METGLNIHTLFDKLTKESIRRRGGSGGGGGGGCGGGGGGGF